MNWREGAFVACEWGDVNGCELSLRELEMRKEHSKSSISWVCVE